MSDAWLSRRYEEDFCKSERIEVNIEVNNTNKIVLHIKNAANPIVNFKNLFIDLELKIYEFLLFASKRKDHQNDDNVK